jgi:hypothetical protein
VLRLRHAESLALPRKCRQESRGLGTRSLVACTLLDVCDALMAADRSILGETAEWVRSFADSTLSGVDKLIRTIFQSGVFALKSPKGLGGPTLREIRILRNDDKSFKVR